MFFAEPARAFANLRTVLKPSGRLAFSCWRKFDENPWLQVPLRAALEHVPPLPRPGPEDPGPFSFASERRVRRILADAGFQSVMLEPRDFALDIACGGGIEEALEAAMALGPASRALHVSRPQSRQCHRCFRCLRVAAPPFRDANYNQSDERDAIACVMAKACFDQGLFDQGSVG